MLRQRRQALRPSYGNFLNLILELNRLGYTFVSDTKLSNVPSVTTEKEKSFAFLKFGLITRTGKNNSTEDNQNVVPCFALLPGCELRHGHQFSTGEQPMPPSPVKVEGK